jgi:hypothetical protein
MFKLGSYLRYVYTYGLAYFIIVVLLFISWLCLC